MDGILVLTFTARPPLRSNAYPGPPQAAGIPCPEDQDKRRELILELNYRKGDGELSPREAGILTSVSLVLASDRRMLQVMTLDSYIHSSSATSSSPCAASEILSWIAGCAKALPFLLSELMTQPQDRGGLAAEAQSEPLPGRL
jgi:hypothetical protein